MYSTNKRGKKQTGGLISVSAKYWQSERQVFFHRRSPQIKPSQSFPRNKKPGSRFPLIATEPRGGSTTCGQFSSCQTGRHGEATFSPEIRWLSVSSRLFWLFSFTQYFPFASFPPLSMCVFYEWALSSVLPYSICSFWHHETFHQRLGHEKFPFVK